MSRGRLQVLSGLALPDIEELQQWSFSVLDYGLPQLVGCVVMVFRERGFFKAAKVTEVQVQQFATNIFERYNAIPYHNFYHAFAVFQGCYWAMIKCNELRVALTTLDQFSLLVAAISHDVKHDGVNNAFHIATGGESSHDLIDRTAGVRFIRLEASGEAFARPRPPPFPPFLSRMRCMASRADTTCVCAVPRQTS
jgi:hypothetical protein